MGINRNICFRGDSGESYRFAVYPRGTQFKMLGAVCLLTKRSYRDRNFSHLPSHECSHIGQTGNLSALEYDAKYFDGVDCICVHLEKDAARRDAIESDLASALGRWNRDFKVTLEYKPAVTTPPIELPAVAGTEAPAAAQ